MTDFNVAGKPIKALEDSATSPDGASAKIHVADYWPFFKEPKARMFSYYYSAKDAVKFRSIFKYDLATDSMIYDNFGAKDEWLNRWYYRYEEGVGVAEWRDDYPAGSSLLAKFGGKKVVMKPPIGWGNIVEIGATYYNYPKFSFFKCWPFASGAGTQIVQFEAHLPEVEFLHKFNDVLVFSFLQSWNGKPADGIRYWMAKNIGPIAVQFFTQDATDKTKLTASGRFDVLEIVDSNE